MTKRKEEDIYDAVADYRHRGGRCMFRPQGPSAGVFGEQPDDRHEGVGKDGIHRVAVCKWCNSLFEYDD